MPPKTLIRSASRADLAAINEIYNHYVINSVCTYQEAPSTADERGRWFDAHGPNQAIIVAELDGQIVGYGSLSSFHQRSGYRFTAENSVYVRHEMLGRGIGGELLAELIRRARSLGYRVIIATVDSGQESSLRLHERSGFVRCGHLKQVGFKFGRWLDVIYLQYLLPPI
jgi:phosphinothricin acetyltransferase